MMIEPHLHRPHVRELVIGETAGPIPVLAILLWNPSRILARPGQRFLIETDDSVWTDDGLPATAAGLPGHGIQRFTAAMCRNKNAGWLELVGALGRDSDDHFRVGKGTVWENKTGNEAELFFYANDVYFMYFNNAGSVMVTVTRLA
ncbi:MAG: hypothetical protein JNM76_09640 [Betaproteobacteria bacterium]|nr:hypothetical protein [Betaproteobacteria bacterium]